MKIGVKVGDVMTRNFVSVEPETSVEKCAKIMNSKKVGSLIIKTKEQELEGIITEGDIIKAIASGRNLSRLRAVNVMSKKIITISPSEDIYNALVRMKKKRLRRLPVTLQKRVIGMLTIKDILRIEPGLFDIATGLTIIKEEESKLKAINLRKKNKAELSGDIWAKEGECEECEAYGLLYNIDGRLICETCKNDL